MKIVTWNVNGIRACAKKGLKDFIQSEKPDIFCIQETKAHREQVEPDLHTLGYPQSEWFSAQRKGYSGVATFSKPLAQNISKGWGHEEYDKEGRVLISEYPDFALYNIYFPNGGSGEPRHLFKQQFLKDLNQHLAERLKKGTEIIVVGDYNVAHQEIDVYDPVRLSKESGFLPEERAWFDAFLKLGFVDVFRSLNPDAKNSYSWWSYRELARISNRGWRIDYICASQGLAKKVTAAKILSDVEGSDHCPVVIELAL